MYRSKLTYFVISFYFIVGDIVLLYCVCVNQCEGRLGVGPFCPWRADRASEWPETRLSRMVFTAAPEPGQ